MKQPEIRYLDDMRELLYDRDFARESPDFELYYMYRGVKKKDGLRYDITVIPPRLLGREFVKTKGHEHLKNYGELYIVLKGEAIYLMQQYRNNRLKDVYAVKAKKGGVVIIPPHYGHVTINPSEKETLETANWLDEKSQHVYDVIAKKQGLGYYFTKQGWIKNKNYDRIPKLRFEKPLRAMPKNLDFLYSERDAQYIGRRTARYSEEKPRYTKF